MPSTRPTTPLAHGVQPSAATLRAHLADVTSHRQAADEQGLRKGLAAIRHMQVQRFRLTYADLLADPRHAQATQFFLDELYGVDDYTQRDAQFARIAGAVERLFPEKVMALAVELAEVHALTEELDLCMARAWHALNGPNQADPASLTRHYIACWARVGRQADRQRQLDTVLRMGWRLDEVVRVPGLRMALRMMRRPAQAAGLGALQSVLEEGFDAFKSMGKADTFLAAVGEREGAWLATLFHAPESANRHLMQALDPA